MHVAIDPGADMTGAKPVLSRFAGTLTFQNFKTLTPPYLELVSLSFMSWATRATMAISRT